MSLFSNLNKKTPNLFPTQESNDKKLETKKQIENIIKASIEALKSKSKSAFESLKKFLKNATPEVADNLRKIGKPALAASIALLSMKGAGAQDLKVKHKNIGIATKDSVSENISDEGNIDQPDQQKEKKSGNIVGLDGKQYEPYHGSVAPKNPDGTTKPGFRLVNDNWYHVVGESVTEKKTDDKSIVIDGKNYEIFYPTAGEHPTDDNGNVKSNYKYQNGKWYKLAGSVSYDNPNGSNERKTNIKRKKGDPIGSNYSTSPEKNADNGNGKWTKFYPTPDEHPVDASGNIKPGYKIENGSWYKEVK